MALLLQLRTRTKMNAFTSPSIFHYFSTFNSNDDDPDSTTASSDDPPSTNTDSPFSSYFSDVKRALKEGSSSSSFTSRNPSNSSSAASGFTAPRPYRAASLDEIRKNLSEFRRRHPSSDSTPPSSPLSNQISLQEIYRRNMAGKPGESTPNADLKPRKIGGRLSFDAIRESVRNRVQNAALSGGDMKDGELSSLSAFSQSLRKEPSDSTGSRTSSTLFGGTGELPASVFGKELREKERREGSDEMKMEFLKTYNYEELGEKLRKLRPKPKGGDWFSLRELNDRLVKLREMEEEENKQSPRSFNKELRDIMIQMKVNESQEKKSIFQRLDILGELGRTPSFMLQPPKENLVEMYFHPDNMSSAEKLKIELARVREEFKMSESDCGSSRVQVAQLTIKIKHLSSVLHKKDKHSRKGLVAMVEKRKSLLKYLRRTDWDSYCLVISKLGLRDNPNTKY
ncbi:uncharacterized protein LOC129288156 [Prosopis cineraria]|uniref:uncharacterized protein LOC129288156 n=1 Tax=Prosopis cineraria TaxID=364024 RepID=UPI00241062F9|nr:uncharacterized protein LOC129288156 [Prosopis cineraria]